VLFNILQLTGGLILGLGYIPQIMQLIRTKSTADLNLKTYLSLLIGISLMEAYAVHLTLQGSGHMFLVTNTLSLLLILVICITIIVIRAKQK